MVKELSVISWYYMWKIEMAMWIRYQNAKWTKAKGEGYVILCISTIPTPAPSPPRKKIKKITKTVMVVIAHCLLFFWPSESRRTGKTQNPASVPTVILSLYHKQKTPAWQWRSLGQINVSAQTTPRNQAQRQTGPWPIRRRQDICQSTSWLLCFRLYGPSSS